MAITGKQIIAGALVVKLLSETQQFVAGMSQVDGKLDEQQKKLQQTAQSYAHLGKAAVAAGGLMIATIGQSVAKAAAWETAFTGVRKTVTLTEPEFQKLSDRIMEMSERIPRSKEELAKIGEIAGQLGIQGVDNLSEFIETMAMLTDTTNIAGEQGALSLARFMQVMKESQGDVQRVGSAIVDLGNNFGATEAEILDTAQNLAGWSAQVNMSSADTLALAATIRACGGESQAAGTAFQKIALGMKDAVIAETNNARESLEKFAKVAGMTAQEFQQRFRVDAIGAITEFLAGLNRIDKAGGSTKTVLDDLGLADIRLVREIGKVQGSTDLLTAAVKTGNDAYRDNTALTVEAEKRYGTLASQMTILNNHVNNLWEAFGKNLLPVVGKLAGALGWVINEVEAFVRAHPILATAIGVIGGAFGGLLVIGGGVLLLLPGISILAGALGLGLGGLGVAVGGLALTVGAWVVGIGIAVAAIVKIVEAVREWKEMVHQAELAHQAELDAMAHEAEFFQKQGVEGWTGYAQAQIDLEKGVVAEKKAALAEAFEAVKTASADERDAKVKAYEALEQDYMGHLGRQRALANNHNIDKVETQKLYADEEARLRTEAQQLEIQSVETASDLSIAAGQLEWTNRLNTIREGITRQNEWLRAGLDEKVDIETHNADDIWNLITLSDDRQLKEMRFYVEATLDMDKDRHAKVVEWEAKEKATVEKLLKESNDWKEQELACYYASLESGQKVSDQKRHEIDLESQRRYEKGLDQFYASNKRVIEIGEDERFMLIQHARDVEVGLVDASLLKMLGTTREKQDEMTQAADRAAQDRNAAAERNWRIAALNLEKRQQKELQMTKDLLRSILDYSPRVQEALGKLHEGVAKKSVEIWQGFRDTTVTWLNDTLTEVNSFINAAIKAFERLEDKKRAVDIIKTLPPEGAGPAPAPASAPSSRGSAPITVNIGVSGSNVGPQEIEQAVRLGIRRAVGAAA